jgi:hypothetical protein
MAEYGLNKIFVEGKSDKAFIDFILVKFFGIADENLVVEVGGKDNLENHIELQNQKRKAANAKNLVIFDTDYLKIGSDGGRKKRLAEYNKIATNNHTEFKIFLLPFDDENEGILENLLNTCMKEKFSFFDGCWSGMMGCINSGGIDNVNIPAQKAFLYSKIDLFKNYRTSEWNYRTSVGYDYGDDEVWNWNYETNSELKKVLNFIQINLFN